MNYFYLDKKFNKSVEYLADCHIRKMIIESCQMLSTWLYVKLYQNKYPLDSIRGKSNIDAREKYKQITCLYAPTHINHSINRWLRENDSNVMHLLDYTKSILDEYSYRYHKQHSSYKVYCKCRDLITSLINDYNDITNVIQCMPDIFRQQDDINAYRLFYTSKRYTMKVKMKWTNRQMPDWLIENDFEAVQKLKEIHVI